MADRSDRMFAWMVGIGVALMGVAALYQAHAGERLREHARASGLATVELDVRAMS